jgi:hypothetical protein
VVAIGLLLAAGCIPATAASKKVPEGPEVAPQLELPQGRKLTYEGAFESERDARGKKGFWKKLVDVIAGEAPTH